MDLEDLEILQELITESKEHLSSIEPDLLEMEEKGTDISQELINRLFRAIHSIKGGFSFFGLDAIVNLTHVMESVLMNVRDGEMSINHEMVDYLLMGVDKTREMIDDIDSADSIDVAEVKRGLEKFLEAEAGDDTSDDAIVEIPDDAIVEVPEEPVAEVPEEPVAEVPEEPVAEAPEEPVAEAPDDAIVEVPDEPVAIAPPKPIPPKVVEADNAGNQKTKLDEADKQRLHSSSSEVLRVKVDLLNKLMNLAGELVLARNQIVQVLSRKLNETSAGESLTKSLQNSLQQCRRKITSQFRDMAHQESGDIANVRDSITDAINREMDILSDQLNMAADIRLSGVPGLNSAMVNVDTVTTDLQENIMRTRMQTLGAVFNKFPRVVRELSRKTGREVKLDFSGSEVELDKSIIESLSDPLTHLLRNAVDHGIELPEDREARGKARMGTVGIRAYHEGGQVNVEISDDGAGIDTARIRSKALAKGLISTEQSEKMDDKDAMKLIFAAGLSTAKEVSDVSGRGVGMDVVRTNIEEIGGSIDIDSTLGQGSTITLKLPLTLAIIPSLIVAVAGRRFAIPQVSLEELVRLRKNDPKRRLEKIQGADVLRLRGKLLPIVRLADLLGMSGSTSGSGGESEEGKAVQIMVLKIGLQRYGLVVDEVLDSEEIVVKPLPSFLKDAKVYAGATIMGDGKVAMILDVTGIADYATLNFTSLEAATDTGVVDTSLSNTETQTLLLFHNHENDTFAINLALVSRIEKIQRDKMENVGGKEYLRYPDHSLRLIRLHDFMPVSTPESEPEELFVIIPKLVTHPMGIIASSCEDVINVQVDVDRDTIRGTGILGSAIVEEKLVMFLDIYSLFESAEPELCKIEEVREERHSLVGSKILLAEDTPFFRAVEKKYIEEMGCKVDIAKDGQEAWDLLNAEGARYDMLVTDIEMPNMDGIELTRNVRASSRFGEIPIVALTALSSEKIRQAGEEAGVTAYEVKLDKFQLTKTLNRVLQEVTTNA
ncbi:MAG: hybrid sensor histidine kinase/response regulator [bacterium]|nr:hybrid sensor histidine kinase/response regulator [bacterium]